MQVCGPGQILRERPGGQVQEAPEDYRPDHPGEIAVAQGLLKGNRNANLDPPQVQIGGQGLPGEGGEEPPQGGEHESAQTYLAPEPLGKNIQLRPLPVRLRQQLEPP